MARAAACGVAGIISGSITMTGLANELINGIVTVAGSAIAKSNPMRTAFNASRLAIAVFIVPSLITDVIGAVAIVALVLVHLAIAKKAVA